MNIFIAGYPFEMSEEDLKALFAKFGKVAAVTIIRDQDNGRPRGFAFIKMPVSDQGKNAVKALNGTMIDGRKIGVKISYKKKGDEGKPAPKQRGKS